MRYYYKNSDTSHTKYFARSYYWKKVWEKRKQKEAVERGRYDPGRSLPDVNLFHPKPKPIPKYIKAYTDDELLLIINFLDKSRTRARELSYQAYTREVERTEHYYDLLIDEHNIRRLPKLKFMNKHDEECRMEISKFKSSCFFNAITCYDGTGLYATYDMVSDIPAVPAAFNAGHVRKDFKYVCWYNR